MSNRLTTCVALLAGILLSMGSGIAASEPLAERCALQPVNGNCKAMMEKFRFDAPTNRCVPYFYDGCGPVVPFETLEDCQALCEAGASLRLGEVWAHEGLPLAVVELEYPRDWEGTPSFTVSLDGREVAAHQVGGGSSPSANLATLELFPGPEKGETLVVEATAGGRSARASTRFAWDPHPMALLLDHFGEDEALTEPGEVRFLLFKADAPSLSLNGVALAAERVVGKVDGASLWRVRPAWAPGRNVLMVEARGGDGSVMRHQHSFVNLADGGLARGERAVVRYGTPGSRSGPFHRIRVEGEAVVLGGEREVLVDALDDEGWPTRTTWLLREIVGAVSGEATLGFYEKPHFLEPERLTREIRLRVSSADAGRK